MEGRSPKTTSVACRPLTKKDTIFEAALKLFKAQVVKLVDTLASGASGLRAVAVQVRLWAPYIGCCFY